MAVIKNVLDEIDIIIQEQIKIFNYNAMQEDRRRRLMEFLHNSEDLQISETETEKHHQECFKHGNGSGKQIGK